MAEKRGTVLPDEVLESIRRNKVALKGHLCTSDPTERSFPVRVLFLVDGRIASEMRAPTADAVLDYMKHLGA